jgi:hypothetical protein
VGAGVAGVLFTPVSVRDGAVVGGGVLGEVPGGLGLL